MPAIAPMPTNEDWEHERNTRKAFLIEALKTRVLTEDELTEVANMGSELLLMFYAGSSGSYKQSELDAEFHALLMLQQLRVQIVEGLKTH